MNASYWITLGCAWQSGKTAGQEKTTSAKNEVMILHVQISQRLEKTHVRECFETPDSTTWEYFRFNIVILLIWPIPDFFAFVISYEHSLFYHVKARDSGLLRMAATCLCYPQARYWRIQKFLSLVFWTLSAAASFAQAGYATVWKQLKIIFFLFHLGETIHRIISRRPQKNKHSKHVILFFNRVAFNFTNKLEYMSPEYLKPMAHSYYEMICWSCLYWGTNYWN